MLISKMILLIISSFCYKAVVQFCALDLIWSCIWRFANVSGVFLLEVPSQIKI